MRSGSAVTRMAPATASAASLINVATMAGPRTNEEKFIDIRWLSPADQPVRWLVGASMFEYESLSAQWFGYAGYLLGLEDELTKNIGIYGSVQWDISDRPSRTIAARPDPATLPVSC